MDSKAFPTPDEESQRTITFQVTFDFDKMYESVLDKHWGWMGERPESFEEYCCMAVASQLADHIRWNEYRTSQVVTQIERHIKEVGQERAKQAAARVDSKGDLGGIHTEVADGEWENLTPEEYYRRRLASELNYLASREARRLADDHAGDPIE